LAAVAVWIGGLVPLVALLGASYRRESPIQIPPLSELVQRFSLLALVSVILLVVSGLYSALIEVRSVDALSATTYGGVVIAKAALLGVLIALGAVNLLLLTPRLSRPGSNAGGWLRWTTRIELSLGMLVLIAAGVLTSLAPAFSALDAHKRLGFIADHSLGDVWIRLRVEPAKIGYDEFGVDVIDYRPNPDHIPLEVDFYFFMTNRNVGAVKTHGTTRDGVRFTVSGNYLTLAGNWRVQVIVKRSDLGDYIFVFDIPIQAGSASMRASPISRPGLPGVAERSLR
jgi:copper transport protein